MLWKIKRKLRSTSNPLRQLENRFSEAPRTLTFTRNDSPTQCKRRHFGGPVIRYNDLMIEEYKLVFFHNTKFSIDNPDSHFMDNNGFYCKIFNIIFSCEGTFLVCKSIAIYRIFKNILAARNKLGLFTVLNCQILIIV